ncbi:hypothetical protein T484DRAFT_1986951 [Baffinella frigidus]|nr:hypothetical protein T484DRAFT_1986951 [Cryptophyta sp. CCMP2293]
MERTGIASPWRSSPADGAAVRAAYAERQLHSGFGRLRSSEADPRVPTPILAPGCIPSLPPVHVPLRAHSAALRACAAAPACILAPHDKMSSDLSIPASVHAGIAPGRILSLLRERILLPRVLTLLHPCGGAPCCSRTWTSQCTYPACPAPLPPRRAHAIPSPAPTTTYSVPLLCMSAGDHPRVSAGAHEFYNVTRQRTLIRQHPLPSLHTHRQPPNT